MAVDHYKTKIAPVHWNNLVVTKSADEVRAEIDDLKEARG